MASAFAATGSRSGSRYEGGSVYLLIRRAYVSSSEYERGFVVAGRVVAGVAMSSLRVFVRSVSVSRICASSSEEVVRRDTIFA